MLEWLFRGPPRTRRRDRKKGRSTMKETTLCYIEQDGAWLMMHRVKKENDLNHDKWVGPGGHFEGDETPEECLLREVYEETGLTLTRYAYRGIVTFVSDRWESEHMHLFTADRFQGELKTESDEGTLVWVPKEEVRKLPLWEGDLLFFDLLERAGFFTMKLRYEGERLVSHEEHIYFPLMQGGDQE